MKIDKRANFYILAGTSGTGKTSVLNTLRQNGYNCVDEAARSVLVEQLAIQGPGLPSNNPQLFVQMMLSRCIAGFEQSLKEPGITFFDRGIPDLITYAIRFKVDLKEFEEASKKYLYNENIFIFPPWEKIFVNDNERRMTFEKSIEFHEMLVKTYQGLGYNLIEVPMSTVEERIQIILETISNFQRSG